MNSKIRDNLVVLLKDGTEQLLDSLIDNPLVKDISIIEDTIALFKIPFAIRDRILLTKIKLFLDVNKDVPDEMRLEFVKKLEQDEKLRIKIGNALILFLELSDDLEKARIHGLIFRAFIENRITYEQMKRLSTSLNQAFVEDVLHLKYKDDNEALRNLTHTGLTEKADFSASGLQNGLRPLGGLVHHIYVPTKLGRILSEIL